MAHFVYAHALKSTPFNLMRIHGGYVRVSSPSPTATPYRNHVPKGMGGYDVIEVFPEFE